MMNCCSAGKKTIQKQWLKCPQLHTDHTKDNGNHIRQKPPSTYSYELLRDGHLNRVQNRDPCFGDRRFLCCGSTSPVCHPHYENWILNKDSSFTSWYWTEGPRVQVLAQNPIRSTWPTPLYHFWGETALKCTKYRTSFQAQQANHKLSSKAKLQISRSKMHQI